MIRDSEQAEMTKVHLEECRGKQPEPPGTSVLAGQLGSWDAGYAQGYADGKAKALDEIRMRLQDPDGHGRGCGCVPCGVVRLVSSVAVGV